MKKETARSINKLMLDFLEALGSTCELVKSECAEQEIMTYFKPAAHISALIFDVLDNIHAQYPELTPPTFGG